MNTKTMQIGPKTIEELQAFEKELDAIGAEQRQTLGDRDARYIQGILRTVRICEILGRGLLMFGWFPPTWLLGAFILGIAKIIDNMELGHNVMHGQFNFMNDPRFHGDTFEWDNTCPREEWRHAHNFVHHTYTNVIGKDRDFGYGMLRLSSDLRWRWFYHPVQFFYMLLLAALAAMPGAKAYPSQANMILVRVPDPPAALLRHESVHATQWACCVLLFLPLYWMAAGWSSRRWSIPRCWKQ